MQNKIFSIPFNFFNLIKFFIKPGGASAPPSRRPCFYPYYYSCIGRNDRNIMVNGYQTGFIFSHA